MRLDDRAGLAHVHTSDKLVCYYTRHTSAQFAILLPRHRAASGCAREDLATTAGDQLSTAASLHAVAAAATDCSASYSPHRGCRGASRNRSHGQEIP